MGMGDYLSSKAENDYTNEERKREVWYVPALYVCVAWCCVVLRGVAWSCVVLRGAAWCCVVLRDAACCCVLLRAISSVLCSACCVLRVAFCVLRPACLLLV